MKLISYGQFVSFSLTAVFTLSSCRPAAFRSDTDDGPSPSPTVTIGGTTTTAPWGTTTTLNGTTTTLWGTTTTLGGTTTTTIRPTTTTLRPPTTTTLAPTTTTIRPTTTTLAPATTTTLLPTTTTRGTRTITTSKLVTAQDNQLDVTLIIDDSNSMLQDNRKLAQRLQGFVTDLTAAGFDWQMCVTVTRAQTLSAGDSTLYWGASRYWSGVTGATPYILKSTSGNISQIFQNTIESIGAGWAGTDDERGIKAAWWHLWNGDPRYPAEASGCYRQQAGLAVVLISDEDERSVGGIRADEYYAGEYKDLELDDYPLQYKALVQDVFGTQKRASFNSIIVKPDDSSCLAQQDASGSKSHYGRKYSEASSFLPGQTGSICATDYSSNLTYFRDQIVNSMASLPLDCAPVGAVNVVISPAFATATTVTGSNLNFNPKVPAGRTIHATYQCAL